MIYMYSKGLIDKTLNFIRRRTNHQTSTEPRFRFYLEPGTPRFACCSFAVFEGIKPSSDSSANPLLLDALLYWMRIGEFKRT
jgi:hypothetical protein